MDRMQVRDTKKYTVTRGKRQLNNFKDVDIRTHFKGTLDKKLK